MSIIEHEGGRFDRVEAVSTIPENEWSLEAFIDLFLGLHDHGYQVSHAARIKLLKLACAQVEPIVIHPKDLALIYVTPGTIEHTLSKVETMLKIGLPAKEICENFFRRLKGGSKSTQQRALEILKDSPLYETAKSALAGEAEGH